MLAIDVIFEEKSAIVDDCHSETVVALLKLKVPLFVPEQTLVLPAIVLPALMWILSLQSVLFVTKPDGRLQEWANTEGSPKPSPSASR